MIYGGDQRPGGTTQAVGFIPRLDGKRKPVASATVHAMGTLRNGSGVADHGAALIQPSLTRRASDGASDRGMNPTANMNCPYGTGEPRLNASFPSLIGVYGSAQIPEREDNTALERRERTAETRRPRRDAELLGRWRSLPAVRKDIVGDNSTPSAIQSGVGTPSRFGHRTPHIDSATAPHGIRRSGQGAIFYHGIPLAMWY